MAGTKSHSWTRKKKEGCDVYVLERSSLSYIYKHTARYNKGVFSITVMVHLDEPDDREIDRNVRWEFREFGKRLVVVNRLAKRKGLTPTQVEIYWLLPERPNIDLVKEWYMRFLQAIQTS